MGNVLKQGKAPGSCRKRPSGFNIVLEQDRVAVEQTMCTMSLVDGPSLIQCCWIESDYCMDLGIERLYPRDCRLRRGFSGQRLSCDTLLVRFIEALNEDDPR
jgi:hypothetical protein